MFARTAMRCFLAPFRLIAGFARIQWNEIEICAPAACHHDEIARHDQFGDRAMHLYLAHVCVLCHAFDGDVAVAVVIVDAICNLMQHRERRAARM